MLCCFKLGSFALVGFVSIKLSSLRAANYFEEDANTTTPLLKFDLLHVLWSCEEMNGKDSLQNTCFKNMAESKQWALKLPCFDSVRMWDITVGIFSLVIKIFSCWLQTWRFVWFGGVTYRLVSGALAVAATYPILAYRETEPPSSSTGALCSTNCRSKTQKYP